MNKSLVPLFVIFFIGLFLTYSNHFNNGFHFDDAHTIVDNVHIRTLKNIPRFFVDPRMFSSLPDHWGLRPVVTTTLAVDYWLGGGLNPFYFLQKIVVVETDSRGQPLLYLHIGYDINHLVKPFVGLIIQSADNTMFWRYRTKEKSLEEVNLLSPQEKKILKLLSEGKSSMEIGHLLFVSPHTIDTHRRNLLKKTYCIDTTALIVFAKMTGFI